MRVWFVFGAILGPVALLLLWRSPPAWCRTCLAPTRGWSMTCWWCGADTRYLRRTLRATTDDEEPRPSTVVSDLPGNGSRSAIPARPHATPPTLSELATVASVADVRRRAESPVVAPAAARPAAPRRRVEGRSAGRAALPESARMLATAVYLSGTPHLEVGGRYGFMIDRDRLRLVGPHDPSVTAFEQPIAGVMAVIQQGNLLLTIPDRKLGTFLAFRGVVGMSPEALVRSIAEAADTTVRP